MSDRFDTLDSPAPVAEKNGHSAIADQILNGVSAASPADVGQVAKVAIVGNHLSTRNLAPYNDPTWEIWGLSQQYTFMGRWSRWFELHDFQRFRDLPPQAMDYVGWLRKQAESIPVYLQNAEADLPGSLAFPKEAVIEACGGDRYFTSSIAWMLGLAIYHEVDEIAIYGVEMETTDEYAYQRPCCEYLIGLARGRGIRVTIPGGSKLCRAERMYGYDWRPGAMGDHIKTRIAQMQENKQKAIEQNQSSARNIAYCDGCLDTLKIIQQQA